MSAHRYLGEVSDVSFFNSVKGLLQNDSLGQSHTGAPLESYEREPTDPTAPSVASPVDTSYEANVGGLRAQWLTFGSILPDRNVADKYIAIYFSTIHIAYPYIDRTQFSEDYEKYWNLDQRSTLSSTSVALICKSQKENF